MFGLPSGPLLDPADVLTHGDAPPIEEGFVVAALGASFLREPHSTGASLSGSVEAVLVAPAACLPLTRLASARVLVGRGLEGDRYAERRGTFGGNGGNGHDLTLIEAEALEELARGGVELEWEEARRNLVTRGIDLNALVGRRFRIGEVECVGRRLAEPCAHLQRLNRPGVLRGLVHRGGLRADILGEGVISVGDAISAHA
ncbi:MAG: MOSC domain-containing protein [Actinobacteria bacterium]|nr:MOSC domain-containing protein [Actinomycetota bacterium]